MGGAVTVPFRSSLVAQVSQAILITGGAGFIGSCLSSRLVAAGHEVAVLDSLHPQVHGPGSRGRPLPPNAVFLPGDVTSATDWDTVFRSWRLPDVIVHLAAETGTGQSLTDATRHGATNVVGTTQLVDACTRADHRLRHVVLASSRAVYGEGQWEAESGELFYPDHRSHAALAAGVWDPVPPTGGGARPRPSAAQRTVPHPSNIYAATKLAQEHILAAWASSTEVPLSILRLQNVYGPGQSLTNAYTGIVALFSRLASGGQAIDVYEDGRIVRDFVFIEDVASAVEAAISRPPQNCRLVDIGSGVPVTVHELADRIATLGGAPKPVVSGRFRDGDVRAAMCSIDAAAADLGWSPQWNLEQGLQALLAWILQAPHEL